MVSWGGTGDRIPPGDYGLATPEKYAPAFISRGRQTGTDVHPSGIILDSMGHKPGFSPADPSEFILFVGFAELVQLV